MEIFSEIKKNKYKIRKNENGSFFVQDVKSEFQPKPGQIFIGKYLHTIYGGLSQKDLEALERELKIVLHDSYKKFLLINNGVNLFSDSLTVYGFGRVLVNGNYTITRDFNNPIPFHILDENRGKIDSSRIKIGSICETGLYLDNFTGKISRVDSKNHLYEWSNIDECIEDLYNLLKEQYDSKGLAKNPVVIKNMVFNKVNNI